MSDLSALIPATLRIRLQGLLLLLSLGFGFSFLFWLLLQGLFLSLPDPWLQQLAAWQALPLQTLLAQIQTEVQTWPKLPFYFVALQLAQVVLAPIPGQVMGLLGGWLFGFWNGLSLTLLGLSLGSLLMMLAGRWLGRPLLPLFLKAERLARFDYLLNSGGIFSFFMIFLLPALPDDAVCLLAGMTRLPLSKLLGVCVLGRLPGMAVLSWTGAQFKTELGLLDQALLLILGGLSLVLWLAQDRIEIAWHHWQTALKQADPSEK